jgi:hypothetical protein
MEWFKPKKLNDVGVNEQYQVKIKNRFAALENSDESLDINRAWESIAEIIKASATEFWLLWVEAV